MVKNFVIRFCMAFITLLIIAITTFMLMNIVPGGPFLSDNASSPEVQKAMEHKYGLDKPIVIRMLTWLKESAQGEFGVSYHLQKDRPVIVIIKESVPVSMCIGSIALLCSILFGIPLGCMAAYFQSKAIDHCIHIFTTLGIAIPSYIIATTLLVLFGIYFPVLPTMGLSDWRSYILPCFVQGLYPMCYIVRYIRSSMLDAFSQEYILVARLKGLPTRTIIFKHALRNSLIPVITYLGPLTANILMGGFVTETLFNIPGLGRCYVQSIINLDYPLIMAITLFLGLFIILMNLFVDFLYSVVDPRIKTTER
jgi:oligopeptide transport system permease protein